MPVVAPTPWTVERVERLTKLWLDGSSAGEIANELGGVSRNAVIGIVHRHNLSKLVRKINPKPLREPKPRTARITRPARVVQHHAATHHAAPEPELDNEPTIDAAEIDIPVAQRCGLLELTEKTCKWGVGDPQAEDFYFCGGEAIAGLPYCRAHSRRAYQPTLDRRRDRRIGSEVRL